MIYKPLSEFSDTELLDLLDIVSNEVKRRNSLNPSQNPMETKRAIEFLSDMFKTVSKQV